MAGWAFEERDASPRQPVTKQYALRASSVRHEEPILFQRSRSQLERQGIGILERHFSARFADHHRAILARPALGALAFDFDDDQSRSEAGPVRRGIGDDLIEGNALGA